MKKILTIIIISLFLMNNVVYGLGTANVSNEMGAQMRPDTRGDMQATALRRFASKSRGPGGSIDSAIKSFLEYVANILDPIKDKRSLLKRIFTKKLQEEKGFIGETPVIPEIFSTRAKQDRKKDLKRICQTGDIVAALKVFRDSNTNLKPADLDIVEGYFEVNENRGELPIARIEQHEGKNILVVHTKFVQMWKYILKNDIVFQYDFGADNDMGIGGEGDELSERQIRTVSLAWGLFYRIAKHEMTHVAAATGKPKSIGHLRKEKLGKGKGSEILVESSEIETNKIAGRFSMINDAMWMWFLASFSYNDNTRYNNRTFERRMKWILGHRKLSKEFPIRAESYKTLSKEKEARFEFIELAKYINYRFFKTKKDLPEIEAREKLIEEYEKRTKKLDKGSILNSTGSKKKKGKTTAIGLEDDGMFKVISELKAALYPDQGPGSKEEAEVLVGQFTEIWSAIDKMEERGIRIFLPQSVMLTDAMKKELIELKSRSYKIDVVRYDAMEIVDDLNRDKTVKRIVIADEESAKIIEELIKTSDNVEKFRDVRLLNVNFPDKYASEAHETVSQMKLLVMAVLARFVDENTPLADSVLKDMLEDSLPGGVDVGDFIEKLCQVDQKSTTSDQIRERLKYFLIEVPAISLIQNLDKQIKYINAFKMSV